MLTRRTTVWNTQHPTYHPIYSSHRQIRVYRQSKRQIRTHRHRQIRIQRQTTTVWNMQHPAYHLLTSYQPPIYSSQDRDKNKGKDKGKGNNLQLCSNLFPSDLPEKVRISTVQESPLQERPLYLR